MNIAPDVGLFPRALAETMKESQLCIFKAKGSVFVTSDMPVVNIYGEKDDEQVYQLLHTDKETALKQYEDMMSSKEIKYWR